MTRQTEAQPHDREPVQFEVFKNQIQLLIPIFTTMLPPPYLIGLGFENFLYCGIVALEG